MKLTIDRSVWLRGEGHTESFLCRPIDGKMCCLGILGVAAGLGRNELLGQKAPICVISNNWPPWARVRDIAGHFIEVNDERDISEAEREESLTKLFLDRGVEVEFIDGPAEVSQ